MSQGSANNSEKLMLKLNGYIGDQSTKLHFGMILNESTLFSASSDFPFIDSNNSFTLLGVRFEEYAANSLGTDTSISGENEDDLQLCLIKNEALLGCMDTHLSMKGAIEFLPPRTFNQNRVVYTNTGHADMTSLYHKAVWEVKSKRKENELVIQLLDRVTTPLSVSYMLKRSLAFGVTPDMCFIVIGLRHLPVNRSDKSYISLYIFQVKRENLAGSNCRDCN